MTKAIENSMAFAQNKQSYFLKQKINPYLMILFVFSFYFNL